MLGVPAGLVGSSGDGATAAARETHESGGASGGSSEVGGPSSIPGGGVIMEESDRGGGGGGNRWPRQETLALLKIRSDMDGVFRDASLKGPLWEEVSRKMAELGFQRSAKKCKEKFENVYKYHKRTKDGRASKPDGKSYRFFDQLEAFENTPPPRPPPPTATPPPPNATYNLQIPPTVTVSSTSPTPLSIIPPIQNIAPKTTNINPTNQSPFQPPQPPLLHPQTTTTTTANTSFPAGPTLSSSSSDTSSDEDIQRRRRKGRKRKWRDYFERLMRDAVQKQEELQNRFLDALEKREKDRAAQEEAWRAQETARMNRERDLLVQERSMTAARDTAMIAFLQKVTNDHNLQFPIISSTNNINNNNNTATGQAPPHENPAPPSQPAPPPPPPSVAQPVMLPSVTVTPTKTLEMVKTGCSNDNNDNGDSFIQASSSRWPKAEIQALIKLRTSLDIKYQENGPKGPLWEEISSAMARLGYNRNPKRCKEKWENINKYYKKVKESNKRRPEDSKTCPYFHQLEEIYKGKAAVQSNAPFSSPGYGVKPENPTAPIMARPEQQWPLSEQRQDSLVHDNESDRNNEDYDDDDDEDEDGGGYEIIANRQQPPSSMRNTVE